MKRLLVLGLLLAFGLLPLGCSRELGVEPTAQRDASSVAGTTLDSRSAAMEIVQASGWDQDPDAWAEVAAEASSSEATVQRSPALIADFQREVIAGDVVHYSARVRTGPGQYDVIGIHRVVREPRPLRPIRTRNALFMLHGDLKDFEGMFIPGQFSPNLPDDFGIAVYLAQHDVDVWGIDQAWNFVPADETEFSFFADWGIQQEVDNLGVGLAVARVCRWLSGNGLDRMLLLGYSSGSVTGYALLNQEAQQSPWGRQVRGFISADCGVRSDDPIWIASWLGFLDFYQSVYDSGQYQDPLIFRDVAIRARTDPGGDSPYVPGLSNLQCALYFGGGLIIGTTDAHYHAPILEDGFPVGLQFVTIDQWLDFMENMAAYEPILFEVEYSRLFAGLDSPFVSHLSQVSVPVLDIGGAGGIAPYTAATLSYLGSSDITQIYVATGAPETQLEYGHIDIFTASNSPVLVWQPILDWITSHTMMRDEPAVDLASTGSN